MQKFSREALTCYATAEKLEPQEPRWPYFQGIVMLVDSPGEALPKIERAADLTEKTNYAPRLRLVRLLIERGKLDEAEKHLAAVLRDHPGAPHALVAKGSLETARGRLPEALAALELSAASPGTAKVSQILIATIQQRLGNTAAADEASRRAASLPADPPMADSFLAETSQLAAGREALLDRGDRLLKSGHIVEGLDLLKKAVAEYPDNAAAWQTLGWGHIKGKNFPEAEKALRRSLEIEPQSGESHFELGLALFEQARIAEAAASFRRAIELRREDAPSHYDLGLCLERMDQRAAAIESFRAAICFQPDLADAYKRLGADLALEGKFDESLAPLRRAVALRPDDAEAATMLERAELRAAEKPVSN
ncbi:MAG: tetratricopeptide repeat protein [Chthoniobacteraceae bacterium]